MTPEVGRETWRRSAPAEINIEVRLVTAILDGIGLQWLLDPSTDVVTSTATYINRTITGWRSSR